MGFTKRDVESLRELSSALDEEFGGPPDAELADLIQRLEREVKRRSAPSSTVAEDVLIIRDAAMYLGGPGNADTTPLGRTRGQVSEALEAVAKRFTDNDYALEDRADQWLREFVSVILATYNGDERTECPDSAAAVVALFVASAKSKSAATMGAITGGLGVLAASMLAEGKTRP